MPTVATGTPGGIWAMLRSASSPASWAFLGTPMTGRMVWAAMAPGSAALSPAMAMKSCAGVVCMCCVRAWGLRWADMTCSVYCMLNCSRVLVVFSPSSLSLLLPIITDTWVMGSSLWFDLDMSC